MKFMKKALLTVLTAAVLIFSTSGIALAGREADLSLPEPYTPGFVPAGTGAAEAMAPALHGVILAMLNRDTVSFDRGDRALVWEGLYNMLSLYGQLDDRTQEEDGLLTLPAEAAADYSAALGVGLNELGQRPAGLADRLNYRAASGCYELVWGSDDLAQLRIDAVTPAGGELHLSGALVYLVDGSDLVCFQAVLTPRDTMFGYALSALTLT